MSVAKVSGKPKMPEDTRGVALLGAGELSRLWRRAFVLFKFAGFKFSPPGRAFNRPFDNSYIRFRQRFWRPKFEKKRSQEENS